MPTARELFWGKLRQIWQKRSEEEKEEIRWSAAIAIYGFLKQDDYLCAKAYLTAYKNLGEDWLRIWEKVMELVAYLDVAPNPDEPMPIKPETVLDVAPDGEQERARKWVLAFYWEAAKVALKNKKLKGEHNP
ncbi:MAG: hypothetical protein ACO2PL_09785 [Armatimonadota bacterium]|jgi:hypothetical protein